jgi:hypothetical protein
MSKKIILTTTLALMMNLGNNANYNQETTQKQQPTLAQEKIQYGPQEEFSKYKSVGLQREIIKNHLDKFEKTKIQNQEIYSLKKIPLNKEENPLQDTTALLSFTSKNNNIEITNLVINVNGKTIKQYKDSNSDGLRSRFEGDIYNKRNTVLDRMERHTNFLDNKRSYNNLKIDDEFAEKLKKINQALNEYK